MKTWVLLWCFHWNICLDHLAGHNDFFLSIIQPNISYDYVYELLSCFICPAHRRTIVYLSFYSITRSVAQCVKQMVKGCCIIDLNINSRPCWECWWMAYDRVKEKQWPSVPSFTPSRPPRCSQITLFYPIKGAGWASTGLPFFAHLESCDIIALSSGEMGISGSRLRPLSAQWD